MKVYFKILGITLVIQLLGFALGLIAINLTTYSGVTIFVIGCISSIVVDIVLSIRWGSNIWNKLTCIFFMPTNYTLIIALGLAVSYIGKWLDVLTDLPPNFG